MEPDRPGDYGQVEIPSDAEFNYEDLPQIIKDVMAIIKDVTADLTKILEKIEKK